ncbi:hypothetical protein [Chryseobacterium sp.]|uniref:hypothetical protein n=1 Tax=Chryseobacterium sp. TaxID=1871047 RepID=UPI0028A1677D|nr:hypothetical protein [Chryseobacterium sp.]
MRNCSKTTILYFIAKKSKNIWSSIIFSYLPSDFAHSMKSTVIPEVMSIVLLQK